MHSIKQFILGPAHEFLAISRGIESMDLSEIQTWSAENGDLLSMSPVTFSWNFHPLPSGLFCLSRTSHLEILFPAQTGKVFTHGILVSPSFLKDYSNNAITLFRHLEKLGLWQAGQEVTRQLLNQQNQVLPKTDILPILKTLALEGGAEAVRIEALNSFVRTTGIRRFASILDQVLGNFTTILTGNARPDVLLESLLDVLPIGCRTDFSFSTGLKFSTKRLFRIIFIGNSVHEQERILRVFQLPTISTTKLSENQDLLLPSLTNRWAMFVATLFEQNLEKIWTEIALLDETLDLRELPRSARLWFKQLGLEEVYRKIRESKQKEGPGKKNYEIFQTRVANPPEALQAAASLIPPARSDWFENQPASSPETEPAGKHECLSPVELQRYLVTLSEAMHGNPLAQEHMRNVFREITGSTSQFQKNEVSEILLREGIRSWNEEHAAVTNQSCHQVEEMVDTLSTMLNLIEEDSLN